MKKRILSMIILIIAVFVCVVCVFLKPMSLYNIMKDTEYLQVTYFEWTWVDTHYNIEPEGNIVTPEDEEFIEIMEILKKYEYCYCLESLYSSEERDVKGDYQVTVIDDKHNSLSFEGQDKIVINNRVYRLCGRDNGINLIEEFKQVFVDEKKY